LVIGQGAGEVKSAANSMVNSAASQLGGGLGSAPSFIPGLGPIMELIGQADYLRSRGDSYAGSVWIASLLLSIPF
jgi:hypothetical protein